jgi:hypothetical protein
MSFVSLFSRGAGYLVPLFCLNENFTQKVEEEAEVGGVSVETFFD